MQKRDIHFNAREGYSFRVAFDATKPDVAQLVAARASQLLIEANWTRPRRRQKKPRVSSTARRSALSRSCASANRSWHSSLPSILNQSRSIPPAPGLYSTTARAPDGNAGAGDAGLAVAGTAEPDARASCLVRSFEAWRASRIRRSPLAGGSRTRCCPARVGRPADPVYRGVSRREAGHGASRDRQGSLAASGREG